jgi:putative ABC transport system substrate-binding protein
MRAVTRRNLLRIAAAVCLSGGAWPAAAARTFKLLFVAAYGGPPPNQSIRAGVVAALAKRGFVEGRNLELLFTDAWIPGKAGGKEAALAAAVARRPDAILTQNTELTRAVQAATRSIPIVFWNVADPVASGIVTSLARPGGNTTGTSAHNLTLYPKRLQLVREAFPAARTVAILIDSGFVRDGFPVSFYQELHATARGLGLKLVEVDVASGPEGSDAALDAVAATGAQVMLPLGPWPSRSILQADIVRFQSRRRIPVVAMTTDSKGSVVDGYLLQYGVDVQESLRICASQLAQIFAGKPAGDIPVEEPSKVELVVNLKAARELGVAIPDSVMARVDRVIQ